MILFIRGGIMELFMNVYYAFTQLVPTDIYPIQYGEEQCIQDHSYGPCVRSNYLLHYVYSGKGLFVIDGKKFEVHDGQMFLIQPNQLAYYKADHDDPWLYRWIEFNGSMASKLLTLADLTESNPIFTDDEERTVGKALHSIVKKKEMQFPEVMQGFWGFIHKLTCKAENQSLSIAQEYIKKAENFIKVNIHKKITISQIAQYVGINRSYLTRLFQEYKQISPQKYILSLKMNVAAHYLKHTGVSVKEVAQSVGYNDANVFNKAFKNYYKVSPTEWRNKQIYNRYIIK